MSDELIQSPLVQLVPQLLNVLQPRDEQVTRVGPDARPRLTLVQGGKKTRKSLRNDLSDELLDHLVAVCRDADERTRDVFAQLAERGIREHAWRTAAAELHARLSDPFAIPVRSDCGFLIDQARRAQRRTTNGPGNDRRDAPRGAANAHGAA